MKFEMLIKEIFSFQDGRTVFVGEILGEDGFIEECTCELVSNRQFFSNGSGIWINYHARTGKCFISYSFKW